MQHYPITLIGDPEHATKQAEAVRRLTRKKAFTLEARLGTKRIKRQFTTRKEAIAAMQVLVSQHPAWTAKDFATVTQNPES
jgi:hypothetical protein